MTTNDPFIGNTFEGKYQIEEKLGEGRSGVVYRATHVFLQQPVAIKILRGDHLDDTAVVERFKRYIRTAVRIDHPNATRVFDYGLTGDKIFFIATEYLKGRTLLDRLRAEGPLSYEEAVRIIVQVCEVLKVAHGHGLPHLDLNPKKIFLHQGQGREIIKVLVPGIPRQPQSDTADTRVDIYSLAVILFEMLAGRPPFTSEPPRSLREYRPDIPQTLEAAILKALSKNPEDRQQSVRIFAEELLRSSSLKDPFKTSTSMPDSAQIIKSGSFESFEAPKMQAPASKPAASPRPATTGSLPPPPAAPSKPAMPQTSPAIPQTTSRRRGILDVISDIPSALLSRLKKNRTAKEETESVDALSLREVPISKSESKELIRKDQAIIRRHTDVSFPARVPAGKIHNLRVQIVPAEEILLTGEVKEIPKPHAHDATLTLETSGSEIRLTVSVAAENFEIESDTQAEIIVPLNGKSPAAIFRLKGESIGPGRIMIDFAQNGRPAGSVDLFPEVVPAQLKESSQPAVAKGEVGLSVGAGRAPDAVIKVFVSRFGDQPGRLHFVLFSTDPRLKDLPVLDGDLGTQDLRSEVAVWVENHLRALGSIARQTDSTMEEVCKLLSDIGCNLYDQILPKALQEICWTLRRRGVRSLMILSDEPHIPWELIKPHRTDPTTGEFEMDEFWGESFALTHWLRGRPPAGRLSLQRIFAVASSGDPSTAATVRDFLPDPQIPSTSQQGGLSSVNEEIEILRSLESRGSRVNVLPARKRELREAFESGLFDLLHLAVHGNFTGVDCADASSVLMEDGPFTAAELSPRIAGAIRAASPLIFFNACQSGRVGFSLTRLGSWSARLVELGCGGFIGSLWPVTDRAALAFARAFYDSLLSGATIGESVLQARLSVRQLYPSDPTWLAYCCFADPMARMEI